MPLTDAVRSLIRFVRNATTSAAGVLVVRGYDANRRPAEVYRAYDDEGDLIGSELAPFARSVAGSVVSMQQPCVMERLEQSAASGAVTTLVSGLNNPLGVAVDGVGNVYIADSGNNAVKELPRAFVDPTAKPESALAGSDVLPVVLPATQNLTGPFAPASDSTNWLTINGVTNGVVNFTFTANTNASPRTGNITVLGQSIAVTQTNGVAVTPPTLTGGSILASGAFQMGFTAPTGLGFTVLSTTNLTLSVTNWTVAGTAVETPAGSGQYQFSDPAATNGGQRFYRVRSP